MSSQLLPHQKRLRKQGTRKQGADRISLVKQRLSHSQKVQCGSLLLVGIAPILGAFCFNAGMDNPLPDCLFQARFGFPSPSCGLTRSFMAFARGDVSTALMYHLFGPLLFLGFLATALQSGLELWLKRPLNLGYRWLAQHLNVLIYGAPLLSFSFLGYYLLRLYVRFHEVPSVVSFAHNPLWQGFTLGAKLL